MFGYCVMCMHVMYVFMYSCFKTVLMPCFAHHLYTHTHSHIFLSCSFAGVFLSLLIFLSIAGNILVCLAIYTERSLRRIGNLFLASLAIADLFVASLVMTFAGVNDLLGMYCHELV